MYSVLSTRYSVPSTTLPSPPTPDPDPRPSDRHLHRSRQIPHAPIRPPPGNMVCALSECTPVEMHTDFTPSQIADQILSKP